jgi:Zn-dependent M28 family amino/carboxypeptidase
MLPRPADQPPPLGVRGWIRDTVAAALLREAGLDLAQLKTQAQGRDFRPVSTGITIDMAFRNSVENLKSENVVGVIRGRDPALRDQYVAFTAHWDHFGIGPAVNGDSIYNGAMDNAAGIATLIEAAGTVAAAKPRRSVLLVAVTAEEKGLLGSRYFALNPTVPREAIVANVNMDMFLPLFPLKSLMVLGLDESDLGDDVRAVAQEMGIGVRPDPQPQRNRFIRSDQYSFIRQGVPALALKVGFEPGSPDEKIEAEWTRERYHAPSDDLAQPIDRGAAAGFTEAIGRLSLRIAGRGTRPAWRDASFFRRFAAPAVTKTTD